MQTVIVQANTFSPSSANSLVPSFVLRRRKGLSFKIIDAPFPGEPKNISIAERYALYAEMPEIKNLIKKIKPSSKYVTDVVGSITIRVFSSMVYVFSLLAIADKFEITRSPLVANTISISGFCLAILLLFNCAKKDILNDEANSAVDKLNEKCWRTVFLQALKGVEKKGIAPDIFLKVVRHSILSENGVQAPLPMNDILGMVRLAASIEESSARQVELCGWGHPMRVSGENSELISRVCEALVGKTPDEIVSEIGRELIV